MTVILGYAIISIPELEQKLQQAIEKEKAEGLRHLENQKAVSRYCKDRLKQAEELLEYYRNTTNTRTDKN